MRKLYLFLFQIIAELIRLTSINISKTGLVVLLIVIAFNSHAQLGGPYYYTTVHGDQSNSATTGDSNPIDLEVDNLGNVISVGTYQGVINSPLTLYAGQWASDWNYYLIKSGKQSWGVNLGGTFYPRDIESDNSGNIFVLSNNILQKMSGTNGSISGTITIGSVSATGLIIDASSNIYVYGQCGTSVDLDPGPGSSLATGTFMAVYDNNLNFVRQIVLPTGINLVKAILDGSGNLFITGTFTGTVDFNPDPVLLNSLNTPVSNTFVAKYTNSGNFAWVNPLSSSGSATAANAISSDLNGNVFLAGTISGQYGTDFDPSAGTLILTSNGTNPDAFLAKYDLNGNLSFAFEIGTTSNEFVGGVVTDNSGNVFLSGAFGGTLDLDPSVSTFNITSVPSGRWVLGEGVFLAQYNTSGQFVWGSRAVGFSCNALQIDANNSLFIQAPDQYNYMSEVYIQKYGYTPTVTTFSPSTGSPTCTQVTISGTNFSTIPGQNVVKFNGVNATVVSATSTSIIATVPLGATTGPITVNSGTVNVNSASNFTVVPINITVTPSQAVICKSSPSVPTLAASGAATYVWTPATGLSATTGTSVTANPASSTTYTVTGTDANGCVGVTSATVVVDGGPTKFVAESPLTQTICVGTSAYFSAGASQGSVKWAPTTGVTSSGTSWDGTLGYYHYGFSLSPPSTTTYTVTGFSTYGCTNPTSTTQVTINVVPVPTVTISPTTSTICSGNSTVLTFSGSSGTTSYSWTSNAGNPWSGTTTSTSFPVTPTINGQSYSVQAYNGICYSPAQTAYVYLSPNPPTLSSTLYPAAICSGSVFCYTPTSFTSGATFSWSRAAVPGISQAASSGSGSACETLTNTTSSPITVTYVYTTAANGCSNSALPESVTVIVNPSASILAQPSLSSQTVCLNAIPNSLSVTASGTNLSYQWYSSPNSDGSSSTLITGANSSSYTPLTSSTGIKYYYVIVSSSGAVCGPPSVTSSVSGPITVNPLPVATITGPTAFCQGGSVTLTSSTGAAYAWSNGLTTQSITVSAGGNYTVTVTDANGCSTTSSPTTVTANPLPTAGIYLPPPNSGNLANICSGSSLTLSTLSDPNYSYKWRNLTTYITGATSSSLVVANQGYFTVDVTNNLTSCSASSNTVTVNVVGAPIVSVSPSSTSICAGTSATLTASGANSYSWSTGATTASIVVSPTVTTSYTVTGTGSYGCTATATATVGIMTGKVLISSSNGLDLCSMSSTTLTATSIPAASSFSWSSSFGDYSGTSASLTVFDPETYTVTATIPGCGTRSSSVTLTENCGTCLKPPCQYVRIRNTPSAAPVEDSDLPTVTELSASPNPASDVVTIAMPSIAKQDTRVILYNLYGEALVSTTMRAGQWKTDLQLSQLNDGVFVVHVGNGDNVNSVKVMILRK